MVSRGRMKVNKVKKGDFSLFEKKRWWKEQIKQDAEEGSGTFSPRRTAK